MEVRARDGEEEAEAEAEPLSAGRRARWVALAFVPSSFMLAVTTYITTEIAAVPLLWIIPLTIYLLSFIVVFARKPFLLTGLAGHLQVVVVLELVFLVLLKATEPVLLVVATILVALFLSALVCHARLADDRPPSSQLTEFYLWVALGGALGGVFNAVIAPFVFDSVVEYPLAIVLACLLRPPRPSAPAGGPPAWRERSGPPAWRERSGPLDVLVPAGIGVATLVLIGLGRALGLSPVTARGVAFAIALLACAAVYSRPVRFGLGLGAVLLAGALASGTDRQTLYADRTFFGVLRVDRDDDRRLHRLVHGNTTHGAQSLEPARRLEPLTYYDRSGPVGDLFRTLPVASSAREVAVIGLGTGTLACYGRPGQHWTFYEIDPAVEDIARDPGLFTYLRDCPPVSDVRLGDARLKIADEPRGRFGMIFVDAFNSDSLPVHLITRQALALYLDRLTDDGVVVVNVTNRYLDLRPVIGALARDAGLAGLVRDDLHTTEDDRANAKTGSMWVALARRPADLGSLAGDARWKGLPVRKGARPWTDDFSNLVDAIKRG
ncbi:MAG TPA: fused MFS/spermidine synthase [Acidimicrobiales bacterium]|nr:fused MFS/spermidine synthase [Acidimicrobiales bacterium]